MDPTTLQTIAEWCGGRLEGGDPNRTVTFVRTDSRTLEPEELFVALRGERFDAHDFLPDAAKAGAAAAIGERWPGEKPAGFPFIVVEDSLRALQQLASAYRRSLEVHVVAITGSNGKTSTKDFTAAVLGARYEVTKTEGNLNNHIGLPLTILRTESVHDWAVWEIGMNHPGEIAPLAAIAAPDVAVITNIGMAHIEFLGSREAIAQEKGMLAEAVSAEGTVVLQAEDAFSDSIAARSRAKVMRAGIGRGDVQGSNLRADHDGTRFVVESDGEKAEAHLRIPGEHMVRNALLAIAVGCVAGLSLEESAAGLQEVALTKGRLEQKTIRGVHVIDDSYNANPDSMVAALRTIARVPVQGARIAVLGRMGELGTAAESGHRRVGEAAAEEKIECVVSVGDEAAWIGEAAREKGVGKVFHVGSTDEATRLLREIAAPGDLVLVKGSRSARMEQIVEGFARL
jgi:UDP-N-acetylmuramoyl-tripeptide--D-alanyl-D-alanine ligase